MTVTAEAGGETKSFIGSNVIGADGGKSTMRKLIGVKFDGMTWPYTISLSGLDLSNYSRHKRLLSFQRERFLVCAIYCRS